MVYMPKIHTVKSWSMFFRDIITGQRTSDIRLNDRRYNTGDQLQLLEYDPVGHRYTGRTALVDVTYIQTNKSNPCAISHTALHDDYIVLSIRLVGAGRWSPLDKKQGRKLE